MLYLCVSFQRVLRGLLVRHACTELYESPSLTHSSQRTNGFISPWPNMWFRCLVLFAPHCLLLIATVAHGLCGRDLVRKRKFERLRAENFEPIGCSLGQCAAEYEVTCSAAPAAFPRGRTVKTVVRLSALSENPRWWKINPVSHYGVPHNHIVLLPRSYPKMLLKTTSLI